VLSQNPSLANFRRRFTSEQLEEQKLVVWNAKLVVKDLDASKMSFPFVAVPSMMAVARLVEILMSAFCVPDKMPLLKEVIMREGVDEKELHISEMMLNNLLRLGTTYSDGLGRLPLEPEDPTTLQSIESGEKIYINIIKNSNVFASVKGGAEADFQPITVDYLEDDATKPRPCIKTTCAGTPSGMSLFVAQGCKDVGDSHKKGRTKVLAPCYIVQPPVNVRDLSSAGRLNEKTGQIATVIGKTKFDLSSHEMQACVYSVVVEEDANAIGNMEEHARLKPMVSTGYEQGRSRDTLCGNSGARAARVGEVDILWYAFFGKKRVDCVELTKCDLNDVEQATVIFGELIGRLTTEYDGFRNASQWMRLHRHLRKVMWKGIAMNYQPTNEKELYHEVRVMIQALTPLRIAMLDGLGRMGGAVYSLLGRLPERNSAEVTMKLCDPSRIIPFTPEIYNKTGATTKFGLVCFDNNGNEGSKLWTKQVIGQYQEYSACLQEKFRVVTQRSVHDSLIEMASTLGNYHMKGSDKHPPHSYLKPGEFNDERGKTSENLNTEWLGRNRQDVMNLIKTDRSPHIQELLRQLAKQGEYANNPEQWEADNLGAKQGTLLDRKDPPHPKKIMTMVMLLTQFQFANRKNQSDLKSLSELQKFILWNGKGIYNKGDEDDKDLGLPPHPDSDDMMGFFPTSIDRNMHNFENYFTWLLHRPQLLIGHAMVKKLLRDGKFQGGRVANLGTRYIIPAGSALLKVYNQSGPILAMSERLQGVMPNLYELLRTNPYEDQSTCDNVPGFNAPNVYANIEPPGDSTKLWSNIPTFVCALIWIAMRSDLNEVPEEEKILYLHMVSARKYYDEKGNLKFKSDGVGGDDSAAMSGWAKELSPKFAFKKQEYKKNGEVDKVAGATLLEMVDLLLNEDSQLWSKVLMEEKNVDLTIKDTYRKKFDALCGFFNWKHHYWDAMGDIKTYTKLAYKNRPPNIDRTNVGLGYVDVKSRDETGKRITARTAVKQHLMAVSLEQKKKNKDEKEMMLANKATPIKEVASIETKRKAAGKGGASKTSERGLNGENGGVRKAYTKESVGDDGSSSSGSSSSGSSSSGSSSSGSTSSGSTSSGSTSSGSSRGGGGGGGGSSDLGDYGPVGGCDSDDDRSDNNGWDGTNVGLGYVKVKSKDKTGKKVKTTMAVKQPEMAASIEQKKNKHEKEMALANKHDESSENKNGGAAGGGGGDNAGGGGGAATGGAVAAAAGGGGGSGAASSTTPTGVVEAICSEPGERRRYSHQYLTKMDKDFMDKELEDNRKDPSSMLKDLGKEYIERAGRLYLQAEFAGRYFAEKREVHKQYWFGVEPSDHDGEGEKRFVEQLGRDNKELVATMWKEGDKHLADQKELGPSLLYDGLGKSMEYVMKQKIDAYVTWLEREVSNQRKEDHTLNATTSDWVRHEQTGKEAGLGTVEYVTRCMQTMNGADPEKVEKVKAKEEMAERKNWRDANWKKKQFKPMEESFVISLEGGESPNKTPPKRRSLEDDPNSIASFKSSLRADQSEGRHSSNKKRSLEDELSASFNSPQRADTREGGPGSRKKKRSRKDDPNLSASRKSPKQGGHSSKKKLSTPRTGKDVKNKKNNNN
jgi:hypothetical protein